MALIAKIFNKCPITINKWTRFKYQTAMLLGYAAVPATMVLGAGAALAVGGAAIGTCIVAERVTDKMDEACNFIISDEDELYKDSTRMQRQRGQSIKNDVEHQFKTSESYERVKEAMRNGAIASCYLSAASIVGCTTSYSFSQFKQDVRNSPWDDLIKNKQHTIANVNYCDIIKRHLSLSYSALGVAAHSGLTLGCIAGGAYFCYRSYDALFKKPTPRAPPTKPLETELLLVPPILSAQTLPPIFQPQASSAPQEPQAISKASKKPSLKPAAYN